MPTVAEALNQARKDPRVRHITVDFWDTIVARLLSPFEVRQEVCRRVVATFGLSVDPSSLHQLFEDAAQAFSSAGEQLGLDYDYRSRSVWRALMESLHVPDAVEVVARVEEIEVAVSIEATRVPPQVLVVLAHFPPELWTVVSDNEMSASQLREIARAHSLELPSVVVSSEHGLTKRSGRLFAVALAAAGHSGDVVLHVGDDPVGDRAAALAAGLRVPDEIVASESQWNSTTYVADPIVASTTSTDLLMRAGQSIRRFVDETAVLIASVRPEIVVFIGSEGAYLSSFFDSRPGGDDASYQAVSLGRRHFLGALLSLDPSWVALRSLVSGIPVDSLVAIFCAPQPQESGVSAELASGARGAVRTFLENGAIGPDDLPLDPKIYQESTARLVESVGLHGVTGPIVVVDIGYRATSASALKRLLGIEVVAIAMFGERPYTDSDFRRSLTFLPVATSLSRKLPELAPPAICVPKVTPPIESILVAGPRAPRAESEMTLLRRAILENAVSHAESTVSRSGASPEDAKVWRQLFLNPPRRIAQLVLAVRQEDDLHSAAQLHGRTRWKLLRDFETWPEGTAASLPLHLGVFLPAFVDLGRNFKGVLRRYSKHS